MLSLNQVKNVTNIHRIPVGTSNCYIVENENAAALAKHFAVPVAVNKADIELFDNYDAQPLKSYGAVGKIILALSIKKLRNTKVQRPENLIFMADGDSLFAYGINAKILELPGHTIGSIALDVEETSLLAGDVVDNWIRPGVGHLYCNRQLINQSAEKIRLKISSYINIFHFIRAVLK